MVEIGEEREGEEGGRKTAASEVRERELQKGGMKLLQEGVECGAERVVTQREQHHLKEQARQRVVEAVGGAPQHSDGGRLVFGRACEE